MVQYHQSSKKLTTQTKIKIENKCVERNALENINRMLSSTQTEGEGEDKCQDFLLTVEKNIFSCIRSQYDLQKSGDCRGFRWGCNIAVIRPVTQRQSLTDLWKKNRKSAMAQPQGVKCLLYISQFCRRNLRLYETTRCNLFFHQTFQSYQMIMVLTDWTCPAASNPDPDKERGYLTENKRKQTDSAAKMRWVLSHTFTQGHQLLALSVCFVPAVKLYSTCVRDDRAGDDAYNWALYGDPPRPHSPCVKSSHVALLQSRLLWQGLCR